jgi:predicted Ser/Thr protein kinase
VSVLENIQKSIKTRFEDSKRVLSFDQYFELCSKDPYRFTRNAAAYICDAIDHAGTEDVSIRHHKERRYKIFNHESVESPSPLIGHESVQQRIVKILRAFAHAGRADKLMLMHGPNGSAKSSLVRVLYDGIEAYSNSEQGMIFSFSWVFPHDSYDRKSLGIGPRATENQLESFANLEQDQIGAIVRSELNENPLYLIPRSEREKLFDSWVAEACNEKERKRLEVCRESFLRAELSHKNSLIFEALLNNYGGDYKKVMRHVRVERYYLSTRLRKGLVTIEPLLAVDASMRQVTLDRSLANLPPALQSLNLFQLEGHLIDGNRGMVEFNDLLKRPLEHFKYLLSTSETGTLSLGGILVFLDTVFIGSTNDRQLEAFREHPEFNSFKARIELIKVPYLLRFSDEEKIYIDTAHKAAGDKEILPHTTRILALWAVASRLKKPLLKNKNALLTKVLENLNPIEKAFIYDSGQMPAHLNEEQRRELKGHIEELVQEHQRLPYYEGLLGPSARELKALLQLSAQNDSFPSLSPDAVFSELRELVKRPQDFEYLRQESIGLYHNYEGLIEACREVWLDWVEEEMRQSLDLEDASQLKEFLAKYVYHSTHHVRSEKVRNKTTGKSEDPDLSLMKEFEKLIGVPAGQEEEFRRNIIARLGAWSVENSTRLKSDELPYSQIFPDLMERLQGHFRETQNAKIKSMGALLLDIRDIESLTKANDVSTQLSESRQLLLKAYKGLQENFHYGPKGAFEALVALIKARYV